MMQHLIILLYLVAFAIGASAFFFAVLYYLKERVQWLIYYLAFLAIFGMLLFIYAMRIYQVIALSDYYSKFFEAMLYFGVIVSSSLLLYIIPIFLFHVLGMVFKKSEMSLVIAAACGYFVLALISLLTKIQIFGNISMVILFIAIFGNLAVGAKYIKNIKDTLLRRLVVFLGALTVVFIPFFIFDTILFSTIFSMSINAGEIILPLFYLWWNTVMLGYFFWYFMRTQDITTKKENNENEYKAGKYYSLTKREEEIVFHITEGKSNKEIAIMLQISLNTVNNHVANIYEKVDVKNRVELVNAMKGFK